MKTMARTGLGSSLDRTKPTREEEESLSDGRDSAATHHSDFIRAARMPGCRRSSDCPLCALPNAPLSALPIHSAQGSLVFFLWTDLCHSPPCTLFRCVTSPSFSRVR